MFTLASRDVTAVDGAPVNGTAITLGRIPEKIVATFIVSTTGTPTTYDMRAAIEASVDGGTTWHQVVRFKDNTNAATPSQIVRAASQTAIGSVDIAASALGSAAAAAVVTEPPYPVTLRAVTKLQTLTGGTTPHIISSVLLEAT
jgi:hypothetical protein